MVEDLLARTRRLAEAGEDSKFERLRAVMTDPAFAREKLIVFTEHRDTAEFLVHRLEGLGFTGQVALIHGGLGYRDREAQVELFRRPAEQGGATYLVATDAAGEGINLQFCWLMASYDVPWNPARLEQRMGRIHRYGQAHDPVVIVNLIAGETREGRVLKVLLDKLEAIRKQLRSDKVFDVVGRLFENVSLKGYLEMATTEAGARDAIETLDGRLTPGRWPPSPSASVPCTAVARCAAASRRSTRPWNGSSIAGCFPVMCAVSSKPLPPWSTCGLRATPTVYSTSRPNGPALPTSCEAPWRPIRKRCVAG